MKDTTFAWPGVLLSRDALLVLLIILLTALFLYRTRKRAFEFFRALDTASTPDQSKKPVERAEPIELSAEPDSAEDFGYKMGWLAIETDDPRRVAAVLELESIRPANWQSGIELAYGDAGPRMFVTPPVEGWVFVVGLELPCPCRADVDENFPAPCSNLCRRFLDEVSSHFGKIRWFFTHRVVEGHGWIRYDDGKLVRAFVCCADDDLYWDEGFDTEQTTVLGTRFYKLEGPSADESTSSEHEALRWPDEEDVMKMAAAWSINPQTLHERNLPPSVGLVGRLPDRWRRI